ncbi:MAG TPA: DUF1800 domain-containing protein [Mycobacteriales bacterium]|nr:DUF1800 domain-containing protein [Mycobacteriales bacterium]
MSEPVTGAPVVGRRQVLQVAGAAAVVATGRTALAAPAPAPAGVARAKGLPLSRDPALHVARRLTFGPTPKLLARIRELGMSRWVEEQLDPDSIDDRTTDLYAAVPSVGDAPHVPFVRFDLGSLEAARSRTVIRQLFSEKQLYEVMVEFWANHFSIYGNHVLAGSYRNEDDLTVARPHALGSFRAMLHASARSPSMLFYLDQWLSDGKNPNENYARELLELHTLGVDGGYSEKDMSQAALALTGWTVDTGRGTFLYRPQSHYVGPLRVLGWRSANSTPQGGLEVGASLLDYLARHASTARFVATKLCRRFVSDRPPASLVASTAKVYLASDTAIKPVLRHIFASRAFRDSVGLKYRRPMELVGYSVRALGFEPRPQLAYDKARTLNNHLETLGQAPFNWPPPDGYPDVAEDWLSTAANLARWNFLQQLSRGQIGGLGAPDYAALVGTPAPATAGDLVDRLVSRLTFQQVAAAHRAALLRYLELSAEAKVDANAVRTHAPALAALILSSPYVGVR